jgi:hypothetical protein
MAISAVPALFIASNANLADLEANVPRVDPLETTIDIGEATVTVLTVPEVKVALLKDKVVAFNVTVNAFAATEAVIGKIPLPELAAAGTVLFHVVPSDVRTLPLVLGATKATAEVPFPRITLFAVNVAAPVPPCATDNGVLSAVKEVISLFAPEAAALKLDLAPDAVEEPVPPSATDKSVIPVIDPPVIVTLLLAKLVIPDKVPPVMATALAS